MSNDGCAFSSVRNIADDVSAGERSSCPRDLFVASGMILVERRINDVADRFRRRGRADHPWKVRTSFSSVRPRLEAICGKLFLYLFNGCKYTIRILNRSSIDYQNTVGSNRQSYVPTGTGQHV